MTTIVTSLNALTPAWLSDCLAPRFRGIRIGGADVAPLDVGPS